MTIKNFIRSLIFCLSDWSPKINQLASIIIQRDVSYAKKVKVDIPQLCLCCCENQEQIQEYSKGRWSLPFKIFLDLLL